jgi:ABC-type transporter MlaC component
MKTLPALVAALFFAAAISTPAAEPSKVNDQEQQQLAAVVKEIQTQQAAIAENQTKIDARMVTVAEALRLARIYASRSGK